MKNKHFTLKPLVCALLMATGVSKALAGVAFDAPPVFPATGAGPNSLYAYDFNLDGYWDLVWLSADDNTVSVALNNGTGQFPTRNIYATGAHPVGLVTLDIDYDAKASSHPFDLAVVNRDDNTVSVLLNNGDGTFKARIDTPVGQRPVSISTDWFGFVTASLDINQDGKTDLAVSNELDQTFSLLLGKGDGTFTTSAIPVGGKPGAILVCPLFIDNVDFLDDVVVLRPDDNVALYFATNGDGTFKDPMTYATGMNPSSLICGWSDMSTHNTMSLVVANEGDNTVSVFKPDGAQTGFQAKIDYPVGAAPLMSPAADWTGLGYPLTLQYPKTKDWLNGFDLTTVNTADNSVSILLNKGYGVWNEHVDYPVGLQPNSYGMADFNKDGSADLIVLNGGGNSFTELKGVGDGTLYSVGKHESATGSAPSALAYGDFDGDGKTDVAAADSAGDAVSILRGNGDSSFASKVDVAVGQRPASLAAGDINGDGHPDLAVGLGQDNSVTVLLNDGHGVFADTGLDSGTGSSPASIALADLNGDSALDLIVANAGSNTVSTLMGEGDGNFKAKTDFVVGTAPKFIGVSDFNGDGKFDVAVANSGSNTVSVLLGDGAGHLTRTVADSPTGAAPSGLSVADVNGDSKADVVVTNATDNTVSVLIGKGDGTFQTKADYATGNGPTGLDLKDVNFDLKPDIAVVNATANTVSVLENKGDGTFLDKVDFVVDQAPSAVAIARIDSDIKPDLIVANQGSNTLQVIPNATMAGVYLLPAHRLTFGTTGVDGMVNKDLLLKNTGTADLLVSNIDIAPADAFSQTNDCPHAPATLGLGQSCTFHVMFMPMSKGAYDAQLSFTGSDSVTGAITHSVSLHGDATDQSVDLDLGMKASPSKASVNGLIKYTLEVDNYGPNKATSVTLTDTLPVGGVWFRSEGAPCTQTGNQVKCNLSDVDVGETASVDLWVAPTVAGKLINAASVSSNLPDDNAVDNSATRMVSVAVLDKKSRNNVDLSLGLKGRSGAVSQPVTIVARLKNAGPATATGTILTVPIPPGASFAGNSSDAACAVSNGSVNCAVGSLAKGASKQVNVAFNFSSVSTQVLTAKVFATEGDKSLKNNTASARVQVR